MGRPSKIDRLPPEVREAIGDLRAAGHTVDEILAHLHTMVGADSPSRSGLHRHIQGLDALSERIQRSRAISEALVRRIGDAPESRQARLNIELMHDLILQLQMAAEDGQPLTNDPEQVMFLAKSLDHLAKAARTDADLTFKIAEEAAKKATSAAAKAAEREAKARGLTAETIAAIKSQILGVKV